MKVKVLEGCKNWLVQVGGVYEVAKVTENGVILKHPAPGVKPTLLKGEYEVMEE